MTRSLEALRWESALISSCSTAISSPPTLRQSKIRRWLPPISMDVWSIPLSPAARPKTPRTTRRTRSPGGGGTSAKRARGSGYTATERSLFNALGTVGRSGAKREDVRSGTEIKVKGLFIRAKTLCAERRQSVHKRFPLDRHQTRERLIKSQDKENCNPPRFLSVAGEPARAPAGSSSIRAGRYV